MTAAKHADLDIVPPEGSEALPSGTDLLGDQFTIERPLSNGGFGITYLAKDNFLNRRVVIKECYPEVFCRREGRNVLVRSSVHHEKYRAIVQMFMREARAIAKLKHPNIVGVHRIFEDNETAYMVLDLIEGRDLLSVIKDTYDEVAPDQIKDLLIKVLDAIDLVHQHDLLHRDISPDNILLDKWGNPILIDFGAAREEASRETRAVSTVLVVKDGYSPQEFYFAGGKQSPSSDLYALGATFYHLISGEAPPNSQTRMAEFASKNPDPCEPLAGRFPEYDPEFLEAIDQAMAILPKQRIQTAREWLNTVTGRKDKVRPIRQTSTDDLNKVLSRLVSETNEYLSSEPRGADPRTRRKPTHAEAPILELSDPEPQEEPEEYAWPARDPDRVWSEPVIAKPGRLAVPARRRWWQFSLFGRT
ncbi:serine/threonine protein kinase [Yoonia litorea]|uniref:Serine/threonine protein kinase n=1 Tax=Yoonia litorea TaxID=1123755 RepID=A0A1I6MVF4_9RHOB|nr:serine/threonine-protein kinase [Yoonia litorea]SFS19695.1 Serine/threonine protein kinase [Yoonia litorea]